MNGLTLAATLTYRRQEARHMAASGGNPAYGRGPSVIRIFVAEPMTLTREGLVAAKY